MQPKFPLIPPAWFLILKILQTLLGREKNIAYPPRSYIVFFGVKWGYGELGDIVEHMRRLEKAQVARPVAKVGH